MSTIFCSCYGALTNYKTIGNDGTSLYIKLHIHTGNDNNFIINTRNNGGGVYAYALTVNRRDLTGSSYGANSIMAFPLTSSTLGSKIAQMKWNTTDIIFKASATNWQYFSVYDLANNTEIILTQGNFETEFNNMPFSQTL